MKHICVIGPSGTGKTSLAKYIAARYRVPFITGSSKELTQHMKGIESHKDIIKLCVNDPIEALRLYSSIMRLRRDILESDDVLVTDRGIPDLLVYSSLQLFPHIELEEAGDFQDQMIEILQEQSDDVLYVFIPFNFQHDIEDNEHRVANELYQKMISNCFDIVVKRYIKPSNLIIIHEWDWQTRVDIIDSIFDESQFDIIQKSINKWLGRKQ